MATLVGPWIGHRYAVGDAAWIWVGRHNGEMTEGKVVHVFTLPNYDSELYVVAIPTPVDPLLEVRDSIGMRPMRPEKR